MIDCPTYIPKILSNLTRRGIDLAEVFFEKRISSFISCEANRIEKIDFGIDLGVGLRVIQSQKTSYAYSNDISESSLKNIAESLTCTLNFPQESISINLNKVVTPRPFPVEKPFDTVGMDVKSNLVRRADHAARDLDSNLIKQIKVIYSDNIQEICLMNSKGEKIEEIRPSIIFHVQVVAAKDKLIQTGYEAIGGRMGLEIFDNQHSPENIAEAAAKRALTMLDAGPAPTGPMTVILSSEAGGTMIICLNPLFRFYWLIRCINKPYGPSRAENNIVSVR